MRFRQLPTDGSARRRHAHDFLRNVLMRVPNTVVVCRHQARSGRRGVPFTTFADGVAGFRPSAADLTIALIPNLFPTWEVTSGIGLRHFPRQFGAPIVATVRKGSAVIERCKSSVPGGPAGSPPLPDGVLRSISLMISKPPGAGGRRRCAFVSTKRSESLATSPRSKAAGAGLECQLCGRLGSGH